MRFLGFDHTTVKASGTASRRDVNLVLVLDRSSSMSNANSCAIMKADAVQFVNMFSEGRDTIGLITFGSSIYTGFQPSKNFKTVLAPNTDTLPNLINQIQCGGNTSSAMALNAAYNMIKAINQSGALNVVLFFTDGYPNGVTGFYPIKTQSDTRYGYSGGYNPTKASPDGTYNTGTTVCGNKNSTCTMDPSPCKDTGGDMYDRNSGQTKRTVFGPPWNVNWNTNTIAVGTGAPAGTIRGVLRAVGRRSVQPDSGRIQRLNEGSGHVDLADERAAYHHGCRVGLRLQRRRQQRGRRIRRTARFCLHP